MQAWDYERASIWERENAKAVQCAADQAQNDLHTEITEASLHSRIAPLANNHLRIQGHRWYVTVRTLASESLYRVWRSQEGWKAAQVNLI